MTKTSTPTNLTSSPKAESIERANAEAEQQEELFYNSIKPQLNKLIKSPSDEIVSKILAYSKSN